MPYSFVRCSTSLFPKHIVESCGKSSNAHSKRYLLLLLITQNSSITSFERWFVKIIVMVLLLSIFENIGLVYFLEISFWTRSNCRTVVYIPTNFCFITWTELHKERLFGKQRGARYKYKEEITYLAETHL